jgi:hypothetical protein
MGRGLLRLVWLVSIIAVAACGARNKAEGPAAPSLPPRVSAPATLLPDGTVPWVEEPAGRAEFDTPAPSRRSDPDAGPCRAGDLRGALGPWTSPGDSGGPDAPRREAGKLIGSVRVTNAGAATCRLRGEVDTKLHDRDGEVPIGYSHAVNDEGRERVTVVPPGGSAELRLDWTAPFCPPVHGALELVIAVPENGGELHVPMTGETPSCGPTGETNGENTSFLSSGAFDAPTAETVMDSPLARLTAAVEPVTHAKPGALVTFHVRLTNPTGTAVSLDPCPGYYQERFAQGTAELAAVNDGGPYRLNCRPVKEIPANGSIRFAMGVHVPKELTTGRQLVVTWWLIAPHLAGEQRLRVAFTLTAA